MPTVNGYDLPGSSKLRAGTMEEGFFGFVESSDLIDGKGLAEKCGITEGTLRNNDIRWLKFAWKGKILFRPQRTIRSSISWDHINSKGCVYGKNIDINGKTYKVRLMRGALTDPSEHSDSDKGARGSEYNRLILPLHEHAKTGEWYFWRCVEYDLPNWRVGLTDHDFGTFEGWGGSRAWAMEKTNDKDHRVYRGDTYGADNSSSASPSDTSMFLGWAPILEVIGDVVWNNSPQVQDKTTSGKTLYEQNILNINGSAMDADANDVVSVKYRVNSGTTRPLATGINSTSYNKSLQFKQGYLYDGDTKVSTQLSDGTQHNIRLWAEDDKGAKSEEVVITFYVVNNRPSKLQIDQILEQNDLVESDTVLLTGRVEDPEGHDITIFYRIGGSSYTKVNTGKDRDFEIRIPVNKLINGENLVTIRSEDTYGAITERTVRLTKSGISTPLKTGVIEYKMTPSEGSAKGLLIWIQREIGDLSTKVEVKFGDSPYKTLDKNHVGLVTEGLEEDEYVYENDTEESDIRLRITMSRMSTSSNKAIKKISGVFN